MPVSGLPRGKITDYGHLIKEVRWLIKGRVALPVIHIGAPMRATDADRLPRPGVPGIVPGRIERVTDIRADKKVTLSVSKWTDEMGNETAAPADVAVAWTSAAEGDQFATLVDNGDGTAVLSATGTVGGPVLVHLEATAPGLAAITGDEMFMVVPGDAQRAEIGVGPEEEVTPD